MNARPTPSRTPRPTAEASAVPAARLAVIGAGLAGLTAANQLADEGHRVTVFERAGDSGGRGASSDHNGYRFNRGPHALYRGGPAEAILTELGARYSGHAPVQLVPRCLYADSLHRLPDTATNLARTDLLGPRAKLTMATLMARLDRAADGASGASVAEWVAQRTDDPRLAALLHGVIRLSTYTNAPDLLDAEAALRQLAQAASKGVRYLDGGWQSLVDALSDRALTRGVRFEHAAVTDLTELGGTFDGIVVAVGGPEATAAIIGTSFAANRVGPPVEAAVLELGVTRIPDIRVIVGLDEPLYASVHAPPTDLAPVGHAVVCTARYLAPGEEHDHADTRAQLLDLAQRLGVRAEQVAAERYLHRMTVTHGLPLAANGGLAGRPNVDASGDPTIAIAGDWVGAHGLLADAAFASGRAAARQVLAGLRVEAAA